MGEDVFALYKIGSGDQLRFPFSIQEYQQYVFGDDRLAHQYGTDLAKSFIAHWPGLRPSLLAKDTSNTSQATNGIAVAVVSQNLHTANQSLRHHFAACLDQHLTKTGSQPTYKVDIFCSKSDAQTSANGTHTAEEIYFVDATQIKPTTIIVLGDIQLSSDRETSIKKTLQQTNVNTRPVFVYLASLADTTQASDLSSMLSTIVSPSIKDIGAIVHSPQFKMNDAVVHFLLGRSYPEFCQFIRRQEDGFTRSLLDHTTHAKYQENEMFKDNFKFLQWEVSTRAEI